MNEEKELIMKNGQGFIAALDQSGGSSAKTLSLYGVNNDSYQNDEEMFDLIHEMRMRVMTNQVFTSDLIIGVILFLDTMNRKKDGQLIPTYLWEKKHMISFLKIDQGLLERKDGVCLMKPILQLIPTLEKAKACGIFGTKMRSVIYEANKEGIKRVVEQQFILAKTIYENGLVPIIEPEVDILANDKEKCEEILKKEIINQLTNLPSNMKIILKLTIPTIPNFYEELGNNEKILRILALSGGYSREEACKKLAQNKNMIASFSRALLEGLKYDDTEEVFSKKLKKSIEQIYASSHTE